MTLYQPLSVSEEKVLEYERIRAGQKVYKDMKRLLETVRQTPSEPVSGSPDRASSTPTKVRARRTRRL